MKPYFLFSALFSLSLLGCQKPVEKPVSKAGDIVAVSATSSTDLTPLTSPTASASSVATTAKPVDYPFSQWQQQPITPLSLKDTPAILAILGTPQRTDPKSLDYIGNIATKTRFTVDSAPYLELIDSKQYLELGWYYANPTDSDSEKALSISHAHKAYQVAQGLLGKEGGKLVQEVLGKKIVQNQNLNGKTVALAKCEFFSCQMIIKK